MIRIGTRYHLIEKVPSTVFLQRNAVLTRSSANIVARTRPLDSPDPRRNLSTLLDLVHFKHTIWPQRHFTLKRVGILGAILSPLGIPITWIFGMHSGVELSVTSALALITLGFVLGFVYFGIHGFIPLLAVNRDLRETLKRREGALSRLAVHCEQIPGARTMLEHDPELLSLVNLRFRAQEVLKATTGQKKKYGAERESLESMVRNVESFLGARIGLPQGPSAYDHVEGASAALTESLKSIVLPQPPRAILWVRKQLFPNFMKQKWPL